MESLSRITSMVETARDLTLEAARDAAARRSITKSLPASAIKKLLESRRDAEVLDSLRRVTSLLYVNPTNSGIEAALPFFTAVVKNAASPNIEIRKLVYALLIALAESAPDTALLSVNSVQRALSDTNPHARALALRTMASVRVPVISQIVALGIKRGAGDMHPVVRRAAALAVPKCYALDPSTLPGLIEQVGVLVGDRQYFVAGAAVAAYLNICPERLDLIHAHYRGLVRKLVDMDEWGQLATLRLMLMYARRCFPRRFKTVKKNQETGKDFYDDAESFETEQQVIYDPDLEILLRAAQSLLQSRNAAVILAACRILIYLGDGSHIALLSGPLVSLLRTSSDIQSLALSTISNICQDHPTSFIQYSRHFLLSTTDSVPVISAKLNIQSLLFPHVTPQIRSLLLTDLTHHTKSPNVALVRASVLAIGRCAHSAPTLPLRARCLHLLLSHLSSPDPTLVAASLDEIRLLIQRSPDAHVKTVVRLAKHLDALTAPTARAAIVWLVGEFASEAGGADVAADVWRILLKDFAAESVAVQEQILLLAGRVYLHDKRKREKERNENAAGGDDGDRKAEKDRLDAMLDHTFLLARYAHSYALRDRARFLRALLLTSPSTDLAALLLLAPKPEPKTGKMPSESGNAEEAPLGYASRILGVPLRGEDSVPPWTTMEVGAAERQGVIIAEDQRVPTPVGTVSADHVDVGTKSVGKGKGTKTLDEWLDEEPEQEDSEETDEEESEEETDEEESDEETDEVSGEESEEDEEFTTLVEQGGYNEAHSEERLMRVQ